MKIELDKQAMAMLGAIVDRLLDTVPEVVAIMDGAKTGELTPEEALQEINKMMAADDGLQEKVRAALTTTVPPKMPGQEFYSGVGLPKMNPLLEAAILERRQFDGDVPELRAEPKPVGAPPAVPVNTEVRNPVALGHMLTAASKEMDQRIKAHRKNQVEHLEALLAEAGEKALTLQQHDAAGIACQSSSVSDPQEYTRGEVPRPLVVQAPTGSALLKMTEAEKKESAFRFLSTTQGRRSAIKSVGRIVKEALEQEGHQVMVREFDPALTDVPRAVARWAIGLDGKNAIQASFALIDNAGKALAHMLREQIDGGSDLVLEVTAVNTVDVRSVGWAARVF